MRIKKVLVSFATLVLGLASKVFAADANPILFPVEAKYGIIEPTMGEKISRIGKFAIPIVVFVIGLFVILSKKITNKIKVIVISSLVALAILNVVLMNYISTNF